MDKQTTSSAERRSFLTRLNTGAASLAALALGSVAMAQVKSAPAARWEPTRHDQDDWMDTLPGKHRLVFDTTSAVGFANALMFADNYMLANGSDYGLQSRDLAIIVIARHMSTGYGFSNEMWAKYGTSLGGEAPGQDAQVKAATKANPSAASLASLSNRGVQFAVCSMATRRVAGMVARSAGISADAALAELSANLVSNARFVPAGIVAVNRAQERGYSLVTC